MRRGGLRVLVRALCLQTLNLLSRMPHEASILDITNIGAELRRNARILDEGSAALLRSTGSLRENDASRVHPNLHRLPIVGVRLEEICIHLDVGVSFHSLMLPSLVVVVVAHYIRGKMNVRSVLFLASTQNALLSNTLGIYGADTMEQVRVVVDVQGFAETRLATHEG